MLTLCYVGKLPGDAPRLALEGVIRQLVDQMKSIDFSAEAQQWAAGRQSEAQELQKGRQRAAGK